MDETFLIKFLMELTSFHNKALAVVCPLLRTRGSTRTLHASLACYSNSASRNITYVAAIPSYGYNLLLPWVWRTPKKGFLGAGEFMDETLTMLLRSGLDVNAPCSRFGPPAHTLAETVVAYQRAYGEQFIDILRCLARHGADTNVQGPHGTVLDTARWTLRKQELGEYGMVDPLVSIKARNGISRLLWEL